MKKQKFKIINKETGKVWLCNFGTRERAQYRIDHCWPELVGKLEIKEQM